MLFRGEGKTNSWSISGHSRFYPMLFRGEGKTTRARDNGHKILPDALPGGRQNQRRVGVCGSVQILWLSPAL